jgi:hypothetical protein
MPSMPCSCPSGVRLQRPDIIRLMFLCVKSRTFAEFKLLAHSKLLTVMSTAPALAGQSPLETLRHETSLGKGSDWAEVLPKLVLHRGWHRLNSEHVRCCTLITVDWQRTGTRRLTRLRNPAHMRTLWMRTLMPCAPVPQQPNATCGAARTQR